MPIPKYEDLMLPLLSATDDGAVHRLRDLVAGLAEQFGLTEQEWDELLPSGKQRMFTNRANWASTYLKKGGLLEASAKGRVRITAEGRAVLSNPPKRIDRAYLLRYPAFAEFVRSTVQPGEKSNPGVAMAPDVVASATPLERIEDAARELRAALADDMLTKLKAGSPTFFEHVVVELLKAMGYGGSRADSAKVLGKSHDGGIDGELQQDRLGMETVYVQAKRWEHTVGSPKVHEFAGSLHGKRARKGVLLTTANFSQEARNYVDKIDTKIVLIDGPQLVDLMIEHDVGVSTEDLIKIKRLDTDFFDED